MKNSTENFIKKLDDASLESVSGGDELLEDVLIVSSLPVTVLSILSGVGCGIANTVCQYKAKSKRDQGDIRGAEKFEKAARVLGPVSLGVGVGGTISGIACYIVGDSMSRARQGATESPSESEKPIHVEVRLQW